MGTIEALIFFFYTLGIPLGIFAVGYAADKLDRTSEKKREKK